VLRTVHRGALAFSLALFLLPLGGCAPKLLRIQLIAFRLGDVDGIWIWRWTPALKAYTRSCQISLSDAYQQAGVEVVSYIEACTNGVTGAPMQAQVVRLASNPDTISLNLVLEPPTPGLSTYRATSFNAAGESALSASSVQL
jgi:hypothetical protein